MENSAVARQAPSERASTRARAGSLFLGTPCKAAGWPPGSAGKASGPPWDPRGRNWEELCTESRELGGRESLSLPGLGRVGRAGRASLLPAPARAGWCLGGGQCWGQSLRGPVLTHHAPEAGGPQPLPAAGRGPPRYIQHLPTAPSNEQPSGQWASGMSDRWTPRHSDTAATHTREEEEGTGRLRAEGPAPRACCGGAGDARPLTEWAPKSSWELEMLHAGRKSSPGRGQKGGHGEVEGAREMPSRGRVLWEGR